MGSNKIQGALWGKKPEDWALIQEATGNSGYEHVFEFLKSTSADTILDVGCGSGFFSNLAHLKGLNVTGLDASAPLIEQAKKRNPSINLHVGEMEELPFEDHSFDIVCAFNSIQYAESVKNAVFESKRVLKRNGKLVIMIWGNKEDCETGTFLKVVGSLLPPPTPGAGGPFALSDNRLLETILENSGLKIIDNTDVVAIWEYPDSDTALRGLLSAGPAAKAIENSGFEKVYRESFKAIKPYIQKNGRVIYRNKFRVVISEKS
ncbi:Methyltransferase domain-containing protein [Pricia antarctica]|uniref:Methyltransferase domain-containing protein n=1 Tax=Pricia antarctica TaxID=641691 RepID=A0A1G6WLJ3_9FLAO|nr:class I SAM-dependent methyltransferase [Pricia antarctica]SDD66659.1 Methyltransferase domain-containing protein [Pricia antarctica]